MELLLGCGNSRTKVIDMEPGFEGKWKKLITIDRDPLCGADVIADLESPLPFKDNTFDELHAYEVLEHLGKQGDWRFFFDQFSDFWRVLKPNGMLCGTTPMRDSPWAWGDPSHTRIIGKEALNFLCQATYAEQVGRTAMSDFRFYYKADFNLVWMQEYAGEEKLGFAFVLRANKESKNG